MWDPPLEPQFPSFPDASGREGQEANAQSVGVFILLLRQNASFMGELHTFRLRKGSVPTDGKTNF